MSHILHDLHSEFPEDSATLHQLKLENRHFQTLSERYHEVNKEVHRIESGIEAASDERAETLKKERLKLLDDVAIMIDQAKTAA
jgi:uncharacterized protein YdcH (DUF465 family)